jgi:uncharacterized protein YbaR (Trm112 family)
MTESKASEQPISKDLLAILVCPADKSKLEIIGGVLVCTECGRHFKIENGIPNMLIDGGE